MLRPVVLREREATFDRPCTEPLKTACVKAGMTISEEMEMDPKAVLETASRLEDKTLAVITRCEGTPVLVVLRESGCSGCVSILYKKEGIQSMHYVRFRSKDSSRELASKHEATMQIERNEGFKEWKQRAERPMIVRIGTEGSNSAEDSDDSWVQVNKETGTEPEKLPQAQESAMVEDDKQRSVPETDPSLKEPALELERGQNSTSYISTFLVEPVLKKEAERSFRNSAFAAKQCTNRQHV